MIPAVINKRSGTATQALEALQATNEFDVSSVEPNEVRSAIQRLLRLKPKRIAVAGGDGTICAAATALTDTDVELAILPGGTLNHFAHDHGIPSDLGQAAHTAAHGHAVSADAARASDRLFLNTSAVGTYVSYVRLRDRLERYVGYRLASLAAALRLLFRVRHVSVQIEVEGVIRRYKTPLVFVGVGERELRAPEFGGRVPHGRRCLHVIVVRERRAARLVALAIAAVTRGVSTIVQDRDVDNYLVDRCSIGLGRKKRRVALDGEIVILRTPVEYCIIRDALNIVVPSNEP